MGLQLVQNLKSVLTQLVEHEQLGEQANAKKLEKVCLRKIYKLYRFMQFIFRIKVIEVQGTPSQLCSDSFVFGHSIIVVVEPTYILRYLSYGLESS